MARALTSGMRRLLTNHRSSDGAIYRTHFKALAERFGPFDSIGKFYASGVSLLWVELQQNIRALEEAARRRAEGRGRRPSVARVSHLRKRQALSWVTYDQALRRLE